MSSERRFTAERRASCQGWEQGGRAGELKRILSPVSLMSARHLNKGMWVFRSRYWHTPAHSSSKLGQLDIGSSMPPMQWAQYSATTKTNLVLK